MLSTTNDTNESKNSLASGRILNFLNNSIKEAVLLLPAIIPMISLLDVKNFLAVCCISHDGTKISKAAFE
jgi:hypothetical protein